jgi:hypothetical protein
MTSFKEIFEGLPLDPLPPRKSRDETIAHAPARTPNLSPDEQAVRRSASILFTICYKTCNVQGRSYEGYNKLKDMLRIPLHIISC